MDSLDELQQRLGYRFRDPKLLRLALTHPSVARTQPSNTTHNQRLEFLGDAVLQLILTRELYDRFPTVGEGALTKARAQWVNRRTLAAQGRRLGLGQWLYLSRGEESTGGRQRASTLADSLEAILGAVYLDGGLEAARALILQQFQEAFGELHDVPSLENPKGELQEMLQARSPEAPQYHVESVSGPDHDRVFVSVVSHQGAQLGRGIGKTKKEAESEAARAALDRLRQGPDPTPNHTA